MPFVIPEHDAERKILEKRLMLLKLFDDLIHAGFELEHLDDPKVQSTFADFSDVLNPCDVYDTARTIYPPHLWGPEK